MCAWKWLLYAASVAVSVSAQGNVFFPGSSRYLSSGASPSSPSGLNLLTTAIPSKTYVSSTPGPNEERRLMEVPKPGDPTPKPFAYGSTTPQPPLKDFFSNQGPFFSSLNRPGLFGNSPFGINDFGLSPFPQFNSGPDLSIFNSGSSQQQPKSYHYRREYNDKDGYTPWVDAGPKRPPTPTTVDSTRFHSFPDPGFHQRFDLGPDGFFDINKDKKDVVQPTQGPAVAQQALNGKTQAIMKIKPKLDGTKGPEEAGDDLRNRFPQLGSFNFNSFPSNNLAQNFRQLKWPGQN